MTTRRQQARLRTASPDREAGPAGVFERYAFGNVSATQLEAETGLAAKRIRMILMNPLHNGWIRRHRGKNETRRPVPWRATPPVSDELWARVEEVRRAKALGEARDAITERTATGVPGQRAIAWPRALSESVQLADVPKEKADLMHAIYERITVAGPRSSVSG